MENEKFNLINELNNLSNFFDEYSISDISNLLFSSLEEQDLAFFDDDEIDDDCYPLAQIYAILVDRIKHEEPRRRFRTIFRSYQAYLLRVQKALEKVRGGVNSETQERINVLVASVRNELLLVPDTKEPIQRWFTIRDVRYCLAVYIYSLLTFEKKESERLKIVYKTILKFEFKMREIYIGKSNQRLPRVTLSSIKKLFERPPSFRKSLRSIKGLYDDFFDKLSSLEKQLQKERKNRCRNPHPWSKTRKKRV